MSFSAKARGREPLSEINVTPFVDVMLVLMIIFMVSAPMLAATVPVALPKSEAQPTQLKQETAVLSITKDRKVFLGKAEVPWADLPNALKPHQGQEVYVRADEEVPYGFILQTLAVVRNAGITQLGLVTDNAPSR